MSAFFCTFASMKKLLFIVLCLVYGWTGQAQSITQMHPADEIAPKLLSARKAAVTWGADRKPLASWTVLQCSDLHGSTENLSRIVEFRRAYAAYIDDAIHTGDAVACY